MKSCVAVWLLLAVPVCLAFETGQETGQDSFELAEALIKNKDFEGALVHLNEAIKADPSQSRYYVSRGYVYTERNQLEEAYSDLDRALALDPHNGTAYAYRGVVFARAYDLQGAMDAYNKAIELSPENARWYFLRGQIHCQLGSNKQALVDFTKAIDLSPNDPSRQYYYHRGITFNDTGNDGRAISDLTEFINSKPQGQFAEHLINAYRKRANSYFEQEEYSKAFQDLDSALKIEPDNIETLSDRNIMLLLQGETKDAQKGCKRLLELLGDDPKNALMRAYTYGVLVTSKKGNVEVELVAGDRKIKHTFKKGLPYPFKSKDGKVDVGMFLFDLSKKPTKVTPACAVSPKGFVPTRVIVEDLSTENPVKLIEDNKPSLKSGTWFSDPRATVYSRGLPWLDNDPSLPHPIVTVWKIVMLDEKGLERVFFQPIVYTYNSALH